MVNFIDMYYPINSLYLSFESTSPAQLFGGIWRQITDKLLKAENNTNTGGTNTHQHTATGLSAAIGSTASHINYLGFSYTAAPAWYANGASISPTYTLSMANNSGSSFNHGTQIIGQLDEASSLPLYQDLFVWQRIS